MLRNSSRNSGSDQERPEFVHFEIISVKISTNVPDSFSRDACGFEFRNGPIQRPGPDKIDACNSGLDSNRRGEARKDRRLVAILPRERRHAQRRRYYSSRMAIAPTVLEKGWQVVMDGLPDGFRGNPIVIMAESVAEIAHGFPILIRQELGRSGLK